MGLISLNGQRTCLPKLLCNARVPVPSQKSVSVTGQVLMLICTNRWIVMDERETFLILKITIGSGLIYVPLYFDPRTVTIKFTCSYFLLPSQFRSIRNQEDTEKRRIPRTHTLCPGVEPSFRTLHVHCDRRVTNQYTKVTCRYCKHDSHVITSNKGRPIVLDVSFAAVIALNLLRRAHDPQQR